MKFTYENKSTYYYNIISTLIAIGAFGIAIYFGIENSKKQDTINNLRDRLIKSTNSLHDAREQKMEAVFELRKIQNESRIKEIKEQMSSKK